MRIKHLLTVGLILISNIVAGQDTTYWTWDCESTGHSWINGLYSNTSLVTSDFHTGSSCIQIEAIGNDNGNQGTGADVKSIDLGSIIDGRWFYYRWWMKIDADFKWGEGTAKMKASRFKHTDEVIKPKLWTGYVADDGVYLTEVPDDGSGLIDYYNQGGVYLAYNYRTAAGTGWHEYIAAQKMQTGAAGNDGEFHFYVDGALKGSITGLHYTSYTGECSDAWRGWMVSPYIQLNGTETDGGLIWLDDYSMANHWNSMSFPNPHTTNIHEIRKNEGLAEFSIFQNYPNPFVHATTIKYSLHNTQDIILKIFNLHGQEVKTLINGQKQAGEYLVEWDGTNFFGQQVESGAYFLQLIVNGLIKTKRIVLL